MKEGHRYSKGGERTLNRRVHLRGYCDLVSRQFRNYARCIARGGRKSPEALSVRLKEASSPNYRRHKRYEREPKIAGSVCYESLTKKAGNKDQRIKIAENPSGLLPTEMLATGRPHRYRPRCCWPSHGPID